MVFKAVQGRNVNINRIVKPSLQRKITFPVHRNKHVCTQHFLQG